MTADWVIERMHRLEDDIKDLQARVRVLEGQVSLAGNKNVTSRWGDIPYSPPVFTIAVGQMAPIDDLPIPPLSPH